MQLCVCVSVNVQLTSSPHTALCTNPVSRVYPVTVQSSVVSVTSLHAYVFGFFYCKFGHTKCAVKTSAMIPAGGNGGGFRLNCTNGNYLASLTIVREECAPKIPVYHRHVGVPLNHMDNTGTCIPEKSAFYNRSRTVMVKKVDNGIPLWETHRLKPAVSSESRGTAPKKLAPCTFGLPRKSCFGTQVEQRHQLTCTREGHCACQDGHYEAIGRAHSEASHPQGHPLRYSPALKRLLQPLERVQSYNLFQRMLTQTAVESESLHTRRAASADDSAAAPLPDLNSDTVSHDAMSPESTVSSYSPLHQPPKRKLEPIARRTDDATKPPHCDLNTPQCVLSELDAFERKEALRFEREEFARATMGASNSMARDSVVFTGTGTLPTPMKKKRSSVSQ